jgi:hypothetical protein
MPISLHPESETVHRVEMSGLLRKEELDRCQAALVRDLRRVGHLHLLIVLEDFKGWAANPDWNDLTFYVQHGDAIERIAIVGDPRWKSQALMFAAAGLRKAPVEFFAEDDLAAARAWLAA